jgi:hypothetical protein
VPIAGGSFVLKMFQSLHVLHTMCEGVKMGFGGQMCRNCKGVEVLVL